MFKGALIFLFGGIFGLLGGLVLGGIGGFFGGFIAAASFNEDEDKTGETEVVYRGATAP